jgi:hypothetical protein
MKMKSICLNPKCKTETDKIVCPKCGCPYLLPLLYG